MESSQGDTNIKADIHRGAREKERIWSILLRESLKLFAGSEVEFIVESPNEKTLAMLLKLGYVEKDEDGYRGVKVRFIYCG